MKHAMIQARLKALLEKSKNYDYQDDTSPDYMSDGMMLDVFIEEIENILSS